MEDVARGVEGGAADAGPNDVWPFVPEFALMEPLRRRYSHAVSSSLIFVSFSAKIPSNSTNFTLRSITSFSLATCSSRFAVRLKPSVKEHPRLFLTQRSHLSFDDPSSFWPMSHFCCKMNTQHDGPMPWRVKYFVSREKFRRYKKCIKPQSKTFRCQKAKESGA